MTAPVPSDIDGPAGDEPTTADLVRRRFARMMAPDTPAGEAAGLVERLTTPDVPLSTLEYYGSEAENGWCKIPRRVVDDAVQSLASRAARLATVERERDEALNRISEHEKSMDIIDRAAKYMSEWETRAEASEAKVLALSAKLNNCQWYWPEDDTSSERCEDSPHDIVRDEPPGRVIGVSRGGVVETTYHAWLPPADDSDSDDEFMAEAVDKASVEAIIDAERVRRAALEQAKPDPIQVLVDSLPFQERKL